MNVFVPYPEPIRVAECLDRLRLRKQVIEAKQMLAAIDETGKGWANHPCTKMYRPYRQWLYYYMQCLECYVRYTAGIYHIKASDLIQAVLWSEKADKIRPPCLTDEFCAQHKRRLFAKNPEHYKQFAEYGKSDENWYFVDGALVKYINGKKVG